MKKIVMALLSVVLLTGCSNKYVQEVMEYLKPTAEPQASVPAANQNTGAKQNDTTEVSVTPDPDAPKPKPDPWMGANGGVPSNAIGRVTVKRDGMEIHQYGGIASQVDMKVNSGDTFYVSQIYMDGSGYRWYCCGVDMWLLVTNMEDIDYEPIEVQRTTSNSNG